MLIKTWSVALLALLPAIASAQAYPAKPIRIVVPFQSGGSVEPLVRVVAQKLTAVYGKPVVIENRPGAGGMTGTEYVAKTPADGYTLLATPSAFVMNAALNHNAVYDQVKDFDAVAGLAAYPLLLAVHPSLPVHSVTALVALAKAQPSALNYSSGGVGTSNHIAAELFGHLTGTRLTHVPYKGGGPAFTALVAGEVHLMFVASQTAAPLLKSGKLRVLAVSTAKRSPFFADVPTVAEAGVPGYEVASWTALFAPAGTPAAVLNGLNAEVAKGLTQADAAEALQRQGLERFAGSADEIGAAIRGEAAKWMKVVKAVGIKAQ
ncbi:MAG TPA: tripartite tricarboxylate transporter substrate binding protein [Burkholderiales bacterium]|nr:tripartite tricarboxylate transporter substrate binding protein [Burkholderiales bacterium]